MYGMEELTQCSGWKQPTAHSSYRPEKKITKITYGFCKKSPLKNAPVDKLNTFFLRFFPDQYWFADPKQFAPSGGGSQVALNHGGHQHS